MRSQPTNKATATSVKKRRERKPPPKSPRKNAKRDKKTGEFEPIYNPKLHPIVARAMCKMGATNADLAIEFRVATSTISNWLAKHSEFADACGIGKKAANNRVERSLHQRATGYEYEAEEVFCHKGVVTRVRVMKHMPADVKAIQYFLNNRKARKWKTKVERSGNPNAPLGTAIVLMPPKEPRKD